MADALAMFTESRSIEGALLSSRLDSSVLKQHTSLGKRGSNLFDP